jgi:hypothetical protein
MKFENLKNDYMAANGTCLQGYTENISRADIEEIFGEPMEWDEHDKVTTEWIIQFSDGTIATIYDWKRYEMGRPGQFEEYQWHIGGKNFKAAEFVTEMLREKALA